jgi:hypothetical protein
MRSSAYKLAVIVLSVAALCVPGIAKADSITPQQITADLTTVNTEIVNDFKAFMNSSLASSDYTAGVANMTEGLLDAANGDPKGALADFQAAVNDFNGALAALKLPELTGDPTDPVSEPSSVLLLVLGVAIVALAARAKQRREKTLRDVVQPAA